MQRISPFVVFLRAVPGAADEDGDNRISEQEFVNVLSKPEAVTALTSLGVDVDAALDYGPELSCFHVLECARKNACVHTYAHTPPSPRKAFV